MPADGLAQVAFAGRSNVGKSSLINALVNHRGLAVVSKTPGRTRSVNFFRVRLSPNPRPAGFAGYPCFFLDLPGYGYARAAREDVISWQPMIESFLAGNPYMKGLFLLVDVRREVGDEEMQLAEYLDSVKVPLQVIITKCDTEKRQRIAVAKRNAASALQTAEDRAPIEVSSANRTGIDAVVARIAQWTGASAPAASEPAPAPDPVVSDATASPAPTEKKSATQGAAADPGGQRDRSSKAKPAPQKK